MASPLRRSFSTRSAGSHHTRGCSANRGHRYTGKPGLGVSHPRQCEKGGRTIWQEPSSMDPVRSLGIVATVLIAAMTSQAEARVTCQADTSLSDQGVQRCYVSHEATPVVAQTGKAVNDLVASLAASLSMIYSYEGYPISQEDILKQSAATDLAEVSAGGQDGFSAELRAVRRSYVDTRGETFYSAASRIQSVPDAIFSLLSCPILLMLPHPTVELSVTYYVPADETRITGEIFDPLPGAGITTLNSSDLRRSWQRALEVQTSDLPDEMHFCQRIAI